jgi:ppGpp synthetase/RelA/SpoT-type nucleotidyltranferase
MEEAIEQTIREHFPYELIDDVGFDDWCNPFRMDASSGAADLLILLERRLEELKAQSIASSGIDRDCWGVFGGGDRLIKSTKSIRSKLARDILGDIQDGKTVQKLTMEVLAHKIYAFSDFGRIRIVADFPSDVDCLQAELFNNELFLGEYVCPKKIKDFVFDPNLRDGLKGHRARQFSVRVPVDKDVSFGFEVQLMTRLQHVWDRRNHPLYEWQRENPDWSEDQEAMELAVDDFACAETLHLVDRQADNNWRRFLDFCSKVRQS